MQDAERFLWQRYWHLICHKSEVEKARDFVRVQTFAGDVVAVNNGTEVQVFDNLCPHRGAQIFDQNFGNRPFVCPYHGWSFANSKIRIADKEQFDHCLNKKLTINSYKTCWVGNFLFFAIDPIHEIHAQLGGLEKDIEKISESISYRHDCNAYKYDSIWQIAVENALEPYHVSAIHPQSLARLKLGQGENRYYGSNSAWFTEVGDTRTTSRLNRLSRMFDLSYQHKGYVNIYLFPFSMISSTFGLSYSIQNFFPDFGINSTSFVSRLYSSRLKNEQNRPIISSFLDSTAALNRQVFEEDQLICSRIPPSSWSPNAPDFYASHDEERIIHFRENYRLI